MNLKETTPLLLSFSAFIITVIPFFWILSESIILGLNSIIRQGLNFFTSPPPLPSGSLGGIGTVLQGTLLIVSMGSAIAIGISIPSSLYIVFYQRTIFAKLGRTLIEVMVEFPTIIVGIAVFLLFAIGLRLGLSALTASIALAVVMIPYTTMQAIEAMRIPKDTLSEAAYALGLKERHVMNLVLSSGKEGVVTGILIGMAKIIGETAPLLFTTATAFDLFPTSINSPVSGIPALIYTYAFSPYENWHDVAWGASLVLIIIVLILYIPAKYIASRR